MTTKSLTPQISKEDVLDLTGSVVDFISGRKEISDSSRYLKVNDTHLNDSEKPIDLIPYNAFQLLYKKATKLHQSGNYVTGLKIHFGVNSSANKICLFYQPVCLDNGVEVTPKLRQYTVVEGDYFLYDSIKNKFTLKKHSTVLPFLNSHKEEMSILRVDSAKVHSRFLPSLDVEAVIFPFQKIMLLISENLNGTHIGLFNAIRKEKNEDNVIKHTILLQAINGNPQNTRGMAASVASSSYGNLANLCPPNGARVTCPVK
jgi:hypothetical protein